MTAWKPELRLHQQNLNCCLHILRCSCSRSLSAYVLFEASLILLPRITPQSSFALRRKLTRCLSTTHLLNLVVNTLYDKFVEKDIKGFDGFNVGILDTFNTINMALPGKHYIAPSYNDVKDLYKQWKEIDTEEKRKKFIEFINEKVNMNKVDESMLITAMMAPPAAMMAKKTGQIVPQLALMNAIPDVVFVPSATLLALTAVKIITLSFTRKTTSKNTMSSTTEIEKEPQIKTEQEPQIETRLEPPTTTTSETEIEEPQTTTTPETLKEKPQIETEQEPPTTMTPEIEKEPQSQTETMPKATIQEPQVAIEQEPQIDKGSKEERSNAISVKRINVSNENEAGSLAWIPNLMVLETRYGKINKKQGKRIGRTQSPVSQSITACVVTLQGQREKTYSVTDAIISKQIKKILLKIRILR
ncbi:hypothetical protein VNO80_07904 [Phaseolus coccineus]|uniref:Calcium ion binding protein n=1 Tax=Phaseolus coccineus TaxID=3886 RepID=A0AAN9NJH7_PHACN